MIKHISAAVLLAATSFAASAAEPKFYVGGDVGSTKIQLDEVPSSTSYGIFAGYNINANFAIEASYRRLAKWSEEGVDLKINQSSVSVLGFIPVVEHVAVYGRLGYNRNSVKLSVDNFGNFDLGRKNGVLYGVGVSYEFTKAITGRIEFQKPTSDSHNVNMGVAFNF